MCTCMKKRRQPCSKDIFAAAASRKLQTITVATPIVREGFRVSGSSNARIKLSGMRHPAQQDLLSQSLEFLGKRKQDALLRNPQISKHAQQVMLIFFCCRTYRPHKATILRRGSWLYWSVLCCWCNHEGAQILSPKSCLHKALLISTSDGWQRPVRGLHALFRCLDDVVLGVRVFTNLTTTHSPKYQPMKHRLTSNTQDLNIGSSGPSREPLKGPWKEPWKELLKGPLKEPLRDIKPQIS